MYKSPICLNFLDDVQERIIKEQDKFVVETVRSMGIDVDKDELVRALMGDRARYQEGYDDAVKEMTSTDALIKKYKELYIHYVALADKCELPKRCRYDSLASVCNNIYTSLRVLRTLELEGEKDDEIQS